MSAVVVAGGVAAVGVFIVGRQGAQVPEVQVLAVAVTPADDAAARSWDFSMRWFDELDADGYPAVEVTWHGVDNRERVALTEIGARCVHLGINRPTVGNKKQALMTVGVDRADDLLLVLVDPAASDCVEVGEVQVLARIGSLVDVEGGPPPSGLRGAVSQ